MFYVHEFKVQKKILLPKKVLKSGLVIQSSGCEIQKTTLICLKK